MGYSSCGHKELDTTERLGIQVCHYGNALPLGNKNVLRFTKVIVSNWVHTGMIRERKNKAQFLAAEVELSKRLLFSLVAQMVKNLPAVQETQV